MSGVSNALISNTLNASLPTATGAKPTAFTNYATAAGMSMKLTSTDSTAAASGTELTGSGYVANGFVLTTASTASSSGSAVTLPNQTGVQWTNASGGNWNIHSLEIIDSSQARGWFGNWNGDPVVVANGNTFAVAQNAVSVSLA
jgi:hypothetical protein